MFTVMMREYNPDFGALDPEAVVLKTCQTVDECKVVMRDAMDQDNASIYYMVDIFGNKNYYCYAFDKIYAGEWG